jgi:GntR family transcriptional regulator
MLLLSVNQSDGTPLYLQLIRQIRHLIATNRLSPGDELPPVRVLAQQLVINPNTVVRAYRELEAAGLIRTRRGSGTYVSELRMPYSDEERRRILSERADALIVESRNLGFTFEQVIDLLEQRNTELSSDGSAQSQGEEEPNVQH